MSAHRNAGSLVPLDRYGRRLRDLRISVIDACNLRCGYCMPEDQFPPGYRFLSAPERLSFDEITRLARIFVGLGVSKIRLTGGEPLLRKGLPALVNRLAAIDGITDLALTTNGTLLADQACALHEAGLHRVTVSVDSLDEDVFLALSGGKTRLEPVMAGIEAAQEAGFECIRINAVVQRSINDHTVLDLLERFRGTGHIVRFIEFMDVGNHNGWEREHVVTTRELVERISARWPLRPIDPRYHGEVATRYEYEDGQGEIGFVSSVSQPFCGACNRSRLSSDGRVYTCLFATDGVDLRAPLRAGADDDELRARIFGLWRERTDRYSETRSAANRATAGKVEMHKVGG